jgi:cytidylate kinase
MTGAGEGQGRVPDVAELTRVVALDGPAGSGKSTVARRTAQALGWRFVDTGATYRAVTLQVLRAGVDLRDAVGVTAAAAAAQLVLDVDPWSTRVELDGEDVSAEIRGPAVTAAVSAVSAVPGVRQHLILLQRQLMGTDGAVVEGRDIATVVAPLARVKVYLDAREEVRALRRARDKDAGIPATAQGSAPRGTLSGPARQAGGGIPSAGRASAPVPSTTAGRVAVEDVQADLRRRDELDSQTNKLEVSEGAIHLDTSDLTLDEVVAAVVSLVKGAGLIDDGVRLDVPTDTPIATDAEENR